MANAQVKASRREQSSIIRVRRIDWMIILVSFVLVIFGLIMVYSASSYNAQIKFSSPTYYLKKQIIAAAIGFAVMIVAALIPYDFWKSGWSYVVYIGSVIAVLMVLSPVGFEANGAKRWLDLKVFNLQPSELVKIGVILIMSFMIVKYKDQLNDIRIYGLVMLPSIVGAGVVLVITDDLGTAVIIFAMGVIMTAVVCPAKRYTLLLVLVVFVIGIAYVLIKPTKRVRLESWLNVEAYSDKESYQVLQGLYAIGSGGFLGKGIGKSTQKMGFVPESQNDMIFSVICEELGIVGAILLIALFAILIWRMWKLYRSTDDMFGKLIVAGVMSHIAVQTFINMGVVSSLLPNTGVPLPFISYGGSSIMLTLLETGLVLSVSRGRRMRVKRKNGKPAIREDKRRGVIYYQ